MAYVEGICFALLDSNSCGDKVEGEESIVSLPAPFHPSARSLFSSLQTHLLADVGGIYPIVEAPFRA